MSTMLDDKAVKFIFDRPHIKDFMALISDNRPIAFEDLSPANKEDLAICLVKSLSKIEPIILRDYEFTHNQQYYKDFLDLINLAMDYKFSLLEPKDKLEISKNKPKGYRKRSLFDIWAKSKRIYGNWCIEIIKENNLIHMIDLAFEHKINYFKYKEPIDKKMKYETPECITCLEDYYLDLIPELISLDSEYNFNDSYTPPNIDIQITDFITPEILKKLDIDTEILLFEDKNMPFIDFYPVNEYNYPPTHNLLIEVCEWWETECEKIIESVYDTVFKFYLEENRYYINTNDFVETRACYTSVF